MLVDLVIERLSSVLLSLLLFSLLLFSLLSLQLLLLFLLLLLLILLLFQLDLVEVVVIIVGIFLRLKLQIGAVLYKRVWLFPLVCLSITIS